MSRWSSRSLGSRFQYAVFYALIRFAGRRCAYTLLFFVVTWYTFRPSVRARSKAYRERRFPGSGFWAMLLHAWRLQWNFGLTLVDRATAGILGDFAFDHAAKERLRALEEEGENGEERRGLILLSAHIGCWQLSPYVLTGHTEKAVSVLVYREEGDIDRHVFEHTQTLPPFAMIRPDDGPLATVSLMANLRKGGMLCMMGDRLLGDDDPAVEASFFGRAIRLPYLPYRLASATGATVAICFALRTGPGRGTLFVSEVLRVAEGRGNNPEAYREHAWAFAAAMERFARKYPYQFFNFYNLWEQ